MYAEIESYDKYQRRGFLTILEPGRYQGVTVHFKAGDLSPRITPRKGAPVDIKRFSRLTDTLFTADKSATGCSIMPAEKQTIIIPRRWIVNITIVHGDLYRTVRNPNWYPISRPAFGFHSTETEESTTIFATIHAYEWSGDEVAPERED